MNKAWLLLLLLLPFLFLSSCADKDEDYPNLTEPLFSPQRDFYLLIEDYSEGLDDHNLMLRVVGKEFCESIKINGHIYPRDTYSYSVGNYYNVSFDADNDDWIIIDENERMLSYEIIFPDRSLTGTIKVPAPINVNFPTYNSFQDYSLNWTIDKNPDFFSYDFYIRYVNDVGITSRGNLEKDVRSHTWHKEYWDSSTLDWLSIDLTANNYKYEHQGMIWVRRTRATSEHKYKSSPPRTPFAFFEQFMKGELSIPDRK